MARVSFGTLDGNRRAQNGKASEMRKVRGDGGLRTGNRDGLGSRRPFVSRLPTPELPAGERRNFCTENGQMIGPTLKQELNAREYELCGLLVLGYTLPQIAFRVGRSPGPMRHTFARMYEKTGTADQLELAVRFAWERMETRGLSSAS